MSIRACDVEVVPVGCELLPEIIDVAKGFAVKELIFAESVDSFDVTLPGISFDWNVMMSTTEGPDRGRVFSCSMNPGSLVGLPGWTLRSYLRTVFREQVKVRAAALMPCAQAQAISFWRRI